MVTSCKTSPSKNVMIWEHFWVKSSHIFSCFVLIFKYFPNLSTPSYTYPPHSQPVASYSHTVLIERIWTLVGKIMFLVAPRDLVSAWSLWPAGAGLWRLVPPPPYQQHSWVSRPERHRFWLWLSTKWLTESNRVLVPNFWEICLSGN